MLRDIYLGLSADQRALFCATAGASPETIQAKYLSPDPEKRQRPSRKRFDKLLDACNLLRKNSITRDQLAAYFYAAPGRTGQDNPEAA